MHGRGKFEIKKIPRFCRVENLIPGRNQVGAIEESLGVPVVSGHAHPFPGIAPFIFFSRGTSFIQSRAKQGTLFQLFSLCIYTRVMEKWQE